MRAATKKESEKKALPLSVPATVSDKRAHARQQRERSKSKTTDANKDRVRNSARAGSKMPLDCSENLWNTRTSAHEHKRTTDTPRVRL